MCKSSSQLDPTQHIHFAPCQGWQIPSLRSDWKIIIFLSRYLRYPSWRKSRQAVGNMYTNIYDYDYRIIGIYVYIYVEYIYIDIEYIYIEYIYIYTDIFFPTSTLTASLHFLEDWPIRSVRPGIGWGEFIETCLSTWRVTVHWWLGQKQKLHTLKVAMFNEEIGETWSNLISVINN